MAEETKKQEVKNNPSLVAKEELKLKEGKNLTRDQKRVIIAKVIKGVEDLGVGFKSLSIKDPKGIIDVIPSVVESVEDIGKQFKIAGNVKLDIASEVINYFVDIPYIPDWAEGRLIKFAIELVLKTFEKYFGGKSWIIKLRGGKENKKKK